jgi:gliding motility-associated-like protein
MRKAVLSFLVFTTFLVLYALNDQPVPDQGTENSASESDYCGSNLAWQRILQQQPDLLQQQEALEEVYYQNQQAANLKTVVPPYTIPVVFHIVHQGGTENIPASSIELSLDHLNQSFANAGPYDPSTGVATNIDFCLAKRKPDGTLSSGIERISDPLTELSMNDDLALKNLSRYDPTQYLNIWVVDEICSSTGCGVAGYAYFPSSHGGNLDGIVVEARWLGNSPANSAVLTHEVGHYLGLYHTFEGGCQNDDCLANGDRVCDTPPDQSTAAVPCNASPNSCTTDTNDGFPTDQPDMFQNYMDYGDWSCYSMFTAGQRDRMHFFLDGIRASLQSSQGCLDPCTSPPSVSITNDFSTPVAQGAAINLTANGVNADTYTWYVDGTLIGTGNPLSYVFNTEGSYNLSVQVGNSDPNCQADAQALVLVRCPTLASFSPTSYTTTPGSVIFFTNASTNATSYEWFVDGNSEATSTGFFYQFDNLGTYTVSLEASNGTCSDDFSVVITVGTQGSSQAGLPIWPMQGGSEGGFHTVDWRTNPPLTSTVGPISDIGGGGTGAAFNSCGSVVFFAAHTAQATPNQLFIYRPDGTPLLDASTANGPGLNAVKGPTELQVIPVPSTQDEWYLIYREYGSDTGAPANSASYAPLRLMYSRVKMEVNGQLTIVVRDQVLAAGGSSYTYSDGMAVSRTIEGNPSQHYLYAGRRALNQNSISVDRFVISNAGISWQDNTGNIPAGYWVLTHAGSFIELSPTEDRVVVGNRNQFSGYVDFIILETASFNAASAITLMGEDLILVPDGQTQDATNILPISQRIGNLGFNNSYPLLFLRNFQNKLSGVEFSPNGRFLYLTSGGYVSSGSTNLTYLAQVDLESDPLEVRLQIQDTPNAYNTTSGQGCAFANCGEEWEAIGGIESSFDGNLYFTKRTGNQLFVIPNPNNFMPQRLVPGSIDLATAQEPNIQLAGAPGSLVDQIDGFNYLSSQSQTVNLSIFGLDCAGDCRPPFEVQISSNDGSYQETFTIAACPTIVPVCADTSLSYRIVDLELGIEFPNAILNGEVNAPLGSGRFEFSEPQGCPEDCDEPYVYFYGEDADYSGRTLLAYNEFIFVGGQRGDEALLTKMTTAGDVVWAQTMQPLTNLPNVVVDLKIDSEGMLIGVGSGRLGSDIASFSFKINPDNGAMIWTRTYTDPASDYFNVSDIFESPTNGDYILLGTAFSNSNGLGCDAAFYSISRNDGDITSQRIHFHLGSCEGIESAVISNNSFFVTGRYNFSGGGFNRMRPAITSFNSTGTALWSRLYLVNVNQDARLYSSDISISGPNNLVILAHGDDNGVEPDNNDFWIISARILTGGVEIANKYTLPEPIDGKEILAVNDGYVVLARARNSNSLYLTRISSLGTVIWAKQLQNLTSIGAGDELIQIGDFLYLTAQHTGNTNTEMALIRIDLATGELPQSCISTEDVNVSRLSNPFPYDGFNSISPYNTQVDGSSDFDLSPTPLAPLPISCAPPCGPEDCTNGIDDDGDGLADCEDPDCDCEEDCDTNTFVSSFGAPGIDETGANVLLLSNGNLLLTGQSDNLLHFIETTPFGDLVRQQQWPAGIDNVEITDLRQDSDGMLIGAGRAGGPTTASGFAFRYDYANNQMLWWQQIANNLFGQSIIEPVAGGDFVFTANHAVSSPAPGFGEDISWKSLDRNTGQPTSNISANFDLGISETFFQTIFHNNKFYHTGRYSTSSSAGSFRSGISRFSVDGQEEWSNLYHVPLNASARLYGQDLDIDDNHLINLSAGDGNGTSSTNTTFFISKVDLEGELIWVKEYDIPSMDNEYAEELVVVNDGFIILGQNRSGNQQIFLTKTDKAGNVLWNRVSTTGGENSLTRFGKSQLIPLGSGVVFSGSSNALNNDNTLDLLLVRTNAQGEVLADCWSNEQVEINVITLDDGVGVAIDLLDYTGSLQFNATQPELLELPLALNETCLTSCDEICGNGTDDDGDGLVDCDDPDLADDCCCYAPPVLELGEDIVVCENGVIVLDAGPGFTSYLWSDLTTEQTLTTTFPGEYSVTVTDQCGNTQSDTLLITVDPASEVDLGPDVTLCAGETLTLMVDGFASYEWFPVGGFDCNTCPTVVFTANADTEIIIVATNAAGCISTDTLLVTIEDTQPGSYTATGLCPGESITFGDQTITEAGLYMDTTSTSTCLTIDSLEVTLLETFNTEENRTICAGQSTIIFGNEETQAGDYSMTFTAENGCDSTHTITLEILETFATSEMRSTCAGTAIDIFGNQETDAGDYNMTFTAENGCDSVHTITLSLFEVINTEETVDICAGTTTDVFGEPVGDAGAYSMTFSDQNGCDSTHTITVQVLPTSATNEDLSTCEGTPIAVFGTPTSETGTYSMTFTASNGCDSTHTINLTVLPTFSTSASVGICPGESTEVFGQTVDEAGEYSMTFTAANGCDSVHTITVLQLESINTTETLDDLCEGESVAIFGETVTESGVYQQTFTAENGCDSTHTITVNFLPNITTTEDVFICEGESIEIFGQQISEPGIYQETFTGSNGCDSTHVITLAEETFSGSAYIFPPCPSDPESWIVYINTNGNGGPYTVSWNGNVVVNHTINNIPVGDHTAIVTSANGCMYSVDFTIRPYNQPWWGLVAGPNCNDPQSGEILIQTEPTDEVLSFSLDGINFSETPILGGLAEGEYTLYVKYGDRCVVTEPITVPGPETFTLALPEDQTIKWGESLAIDPTTNVGPGAIYQWTPAGSLDCPACDKVVAQPEETTRYFLKVTDQNGCTEVDDILVKVDRRIPYYVPNAFTPNNDGKNDFFTVYAATGVEEVMQMAIFDRWGGEVYVRTNFPPNREELGWDGRSREKQVTAGVYVYYLELKLSTGEVVMVKGDVALIR